MAVIKAHSQYEHTYWPIKVYIYRRGFARFTNARYSSRMEDIYDDFMHLTNVAIQKTAENYDERTGKLTNKLQCIALSVFESFLLKFLKILQIKFRAIKFNILYNL